MADTRYNPSPIERVLGGKIQFVLFALFGLLLSYIIATVLVDQSNVMGLKYSVILFIGGVSLLWFLTTERIQIAILLLILYMGLFEGVFKFTTDGLLFYLVYAVRNVLTASLILNVFFKAYNRKLEAAGFHFTWPPFTLLIGFYLLWVLINIFHPEGINLMNSIAGARPHIEFVPFYFLGFLICTKEPKWFVHLLITIVIIGVINSAVAIHQYKIGPENLVAVYGEGYAKLISTETIEQQEEGTGRTSAYRGRVYLDNENNAQLRPPGLGSDAGFPAMVAEIAVFSLLVLLFYYLKMRNFWLVGFLVAASLLLFAGIVVSAARSYLLLTLVGVTIGALFYIREIFAGQKLKIVVLVIVGITILGGNYVIKSYVSDNAYDRFQNISTPEKLYNRLKDEKFRNWAYTQRYLIESPLGRGLGKVGSATAFFATRDDVEVVTGNGETEFNFFLSELGVVGLLLFYAILLATFLKSSVIMRRSEADSYQRMSATVIFLFILVFFLNSPFGTGAPFPTKASLWLFMGCFWALHNKPDKFYLPTKLRQW